MQFYFLMQNMFVKMYTNVLLYFTLSWPDELATCDSTVVICVGTLKKSMAFQYYIRITHSFIRSLDFYVIAKNPYI